MPGKLILVRHGQSTWNLENLFTGWTDVDLADCGRAEAAQAGREVLAQAVGVDVALTWVLDRPIRNLWIIRSVRMGRLSSEVKATATHPASPANPRAASAHQ